MNNSRNCPETGAAVFRIERLCKSYALEKRKLDVLRGIGFDVQPGEKVAIVGASGSGKSTLLNVIGGLDRPDSGTVFFEGRDLYARSARARARIRARRVGFVFQAFHLLPELNVLENVLLPAWTHWSAFWNHRALEKRGHELMARVGLGDRASHRPSELSGGEQQRVAIARALMNDPDVILADEPTGNLDSTTGEQVLRCLFDLAGDAHRTVLLVTHNPDIARRCNRTLSLRDGVMEA